MAEHTYKGGLGLTFDIKSISDRPLVILVPVQKGWIGAYRLDYDSKYITLRGKTKDWPLNNPFQKKGEPDTYEEMILIPLVAEVRNVAPQITKVTDRFIEITCHDSWDDWIPLDNK